MLINATVKSGMKLPSLV